MVTVNGPSRKALAESPGSPGKAKLSGSNALEFQFTVNTVRKRTPSE